MTERVYTTPELLAERPVGQVNFAPGDGITYKAFVCHGCQCCWLMNDAGEVEWGYPHFLSFDKAP